MLHESETLQYSAGSEALCSWFTQKERQAEGSNKGAFIKPGLRRQE